MKYPEKAKLQRQRRDHLVACGGIEECLQTSTREHFGSVLKLDHGKAPTTV